MKTKPKLLRILTPPPVAGSNLLHGANLEAIAEKALTAHLSKTVPSSAARTCPHKIHLVTVHPSQPYVTYLITPEGPEKKQHLKSIVVQHIHTQQIVYHKSLGEIASLLSDYDLLAKTSKDRQHKIVKDLGRLQHLDFYDPSTLYWSGHTAPASKTPSEIDNSRFNYLVVQFTSRILILNLRKSDSIHIMKPSVAPPHMQTLQAHITPETLGGTSSMIGSNAVPLSPQCLVVGTTDGSLKVYDWITKNVILSTKNMLTSKSDWIVHLCATNPYHTTPPASPPTRTKLIGLTKKGGAYLFEVVWSSSNPGTVKDILPPAAKFEGGSVPISMSKTDHDDFHSSSSMEHVFLKYDAYRNLVIWCHPSKSKAKLVAWDLGRIPEQDSKQKKKGEPVKPDPTLVMQFPYETNHTIFPGWLSGTFAPADAMTCIAVTREGDFQILMSSLYNSASSVKNPFPAALLFSVNLAQVIQRDLQLAEAPHIKVQSVTCPPLRDTSTFYVATNIGVILIKMMDDNLIAIPGARHAYLSANVGGLGKAVFNVRQSEISYGSLEPTDVGGSGSLGNMNPVGDMESKSNIKVYESPPPLHLPDIHKRPVRLPPSFLHSPSRNYICCFWKEEMRYEVLHIPTMLQRVSSRADTGSPPVVASGTGVTSFAWIGDDDIFSVLYHPEQDLALQTGVDLSAPTASLGKDLAHAAKNVTDLKKLKELANIQSVKGAAKKSKKLVTKMAVGTQKATLGTTKGMAKMTVGGASKVVGGASKATKNVFAGLKLKKKHDKTEEASVTTASEDGSVRPITGVGTSAPVAFDENAKGGSLDRKQPWIELRSLENVADGASAFGGSSAAATAVNLGELMLRSGKRNPPTMLFGGPVLCVGSKVDESDEGLAYFYTRKRGEANDTAKVYVSSGPAFPCPDLVSWDDDGRLCAIVIQNRVSIYLSEEPHFVMLGTTRIGSSSDVDVQVVSARFIHGVLFCTTNASVQAIFLGDLEGDICNIDTYTLVSCDTPTLPSRSSLSEYKSLTPPTWPMPLNRPFILGFQNGSLIISTTVGVQAISLDHPLLRIGTLLSAGQQAKACKWFNAVPDADHESLATFLDRRGSPELALQLQSMSLEMTIDLCMRYRFVEKLEEIVDLYGIRGLRAVDQGTGFSSDIYGPEDNGISMVVSVGAYLLSQGKIELVRRMATESLEYGDEGNKDAFFLSSLLLSIDPTDAKRVMWRAVEDEDQDSDWIIGSFVKNHVLSSSRE